MSELLHFEGKRHGKDSNAKAGRFGAMPKEL